MTSRLILPFASWPEVDRNLWLALVTPAAGSMDHAGALSHLRPTTLSILRIGYGRWLTWLQANEPAALAEEPASRGSAERLWAWVQSLDNVTPMSRSLYLDGALRLMTAAVPGEDWTAQWRLRARVRQAALRNRGHRKEGRILSSAVLVQAGLDLAGPRADAAPKPVQAMRDRRDGLLVAFLALLPLRGRTLASLELRRSVLRVGDRFVISSPGETTKNGHHWEAPLPDLIREPSARYLDEVRPWLMARGGASHQMLWVQNYGRPYPAEYLRVRVGTVTTRLFGVRVPPHFFRDAAATTLARSSAADARLIRPLLGHAEYGTAERHYIHAQGIETGRDYAAVLARLKEESKA